MAKTNTPLNHQKQWLDSMSGADRWTRRVFSQTKPHLGSRVLEIGCGTGNFTELIAGSCLQVVACDIDPEFVSITRQKLAAQQNVSVLHGDALLIEPESSFDTVVMLDVLEHLQDDEAVLRKVFKHLRPGGCLILKVPAGPWLMGPLDVALGHHRRYRKVALQTLVEATGFETQSIRHVGRVASLGWFANGRLLGRHAVPAVQIKFFNFLLPLIDLVEVVLPLPFGLTLLCVARRPFQG